MKRSRLSIVPWILACGLIATSLGETRAANARDDSLKSAIERILTETYPDDEPGVAVIVVRDGEVLYRGARGMANLELGVSLEPDMVFRLGSITKQFTAAAILLLEEMGKLSVTDPITKYLPDYPVHGHTITIEHLLTHTSGIFSYTSIPGYMDARIRRDLSTNELIDQFKAEEMEFAPGEKWSYSNSGYVLAGAIVEKASGMSYAEFVRENIFSPLGMHHSHYGGHQLIPRRVSGYERRDDSYLNARYLSMTQPHGAGSLLSNVDDLARWDEALYGDKLLSARSRERMVTAYKLNNRESTDYAYGFHIDKLRGARSITHGGGIFGFSTRAIRLPEERVYVAVLSNGSRVGPGRIASTLAALAIGRPFPQRKRVEVDASILKRYAGVYRSSKEFTLSVSVEDGRLYIRDGSGRRRESVPHSETGFFHQDSLTHVEFVKIEDGIATHLLVYPSGRDEPEKLVRTEE